MSPPPPLRVGYVPEHFSTPLHFARLHHSLNITPIPFPSGTGHMITSLHSNELDVAIGLTEAWISGLGKAQSENRDAGYRLVGSYVETPLCWAISTGAKREDIGDEAALEGLKGKKMGGMRADVSGSGGCSGSYVMGFVLADQQGWLSASSEHSTEPFEDIVPLQTFEKLRAAVNDGTADFFMWEHFTTKKYYDNRVLKRVGEIYTPWPSWEIVASPEVVSERTRLDEFCEKLNLGIEYFKAHQEEAVRYISTELDYSEEDAREWLKTVKFAGNVKGVERSAVKQVLDTLQKSGVLGTDFRDEVVDKMIALQRDG